MARQLTIEEAADSIINWAYSDSHVKLDRQVLIDQLREDEGFSGCRPTEKECEWLVTSDDDGEIPGDVEEHFPKTCAFVGSYWE